MGRAGAARGRLPGRRLDRAGPVAGGAGGRRSSAACSRSGGARGLGLRGAAWLTLAAFVVSAVALALRPQLIGMALFAVTLLLVADRRAHPGRLWLVPVARARLGQRPRQLLPRSAGAGPGLARGPRTIARSGPTGTLLVAVVAAVAACVTPFGPAVWTYAAGAVHEPAGDPPDHGVAADLARPTSRGCCSSGPLLAVGAAARPAGPGDAAGRRSCGSPSSSRSACTRRAASRGGRWRPLVRSPGCW